MTETKAIGQIVDKITDKLSIATDKLESLALETLQQYQTKQIVEAIIFGICAVFGAVLIILGIRRLCRTSREEGLDDISNGACIYVSATIFPGFFFFLICIIALVQSLLAAIAPLPSILGL